MNSDNQPLAKKDFDESINKLQKTLVGGMNQILTTLIDHMDKRFEQVDDSFNRLEGKVDNVTDDHEVRISKLEKQRI